MEPIIEPLSRRDSLLRSFEITTRSLVWPSRPEVGRTGPCAPGVWSFSVIGTPDPSNFGVENSVWGVAVTYERPIVLNEDTNPQTQLTALNEFGAKRRAIGRWGFTQATNWTVLTPFVDGRVFESEYAKVYGSSIRAHAAFPTEVYFEVESDFSFTVNAEWTVRGELVFP